MENFDFGQKRMPYERASQEEQNGANYSCVALPVRSKKLHKTNGNIRIGPEDCVSVAPSSEKLQTIQTGKESGLATIRIINTKCLTSCLNGKSLPLLTVGYVDASRNATGGKGDDI